MNIRDFIFIIIISITIFIVSAYINKYRSLTEYYITLHNIETNSDYVVCVDRHDAIHLVKKCEEENTIRNRYELHLFINTKYGVNINNYIKEYYQEK